MKGWGRRLTLALVLGALTGAGLMAYGDVQPVRKALEDLDAHLLIGALALSFGNYLIRAARFSWLLDAVGVRVPRAEGALVFFAGLAMSVTPGKVGEWIKASLLAFRHEASTCMTAPVLVAERLSDLIALLLLSSWGLHVWAPDGVWSVVCLASASAVFFGASSPRWTRGLFGAVGARCRRSRWRDRWLSHEAALDQLLTAWQSSLSRRSLAASVGLALAAWSLQVAALFVLVSGFTQDYTWSAACFSYCVPLVAGVLSLVPGGLAITEWGMASALTRTGSTWATPGNVVALTLITRLVTLWFAVACGALALFAHRLLFGWTPSQLESGGPAPTLESPGGLENPGELARTLTEPARAPLITSTSEG